MNRFLRIAGVALGVALTLGIGAIALANSGSAGTMVGVVATAREAALDVKDQPGSKGSIVVGSVTAPGPSWIVVHLDEGGKPGMRVGVLRIPGGTSTAVRVPIEPTGMSEKVIVAVHADRGVGGKFEFDMKAFEASPDKPYFVGGTELAREVVVR